jgi:ABC-type sugar transport system permease subunit
VKKRLGLTMKTRHYLEGYSFISIWVAGFLLFLAVPLGKSLYYAFQKMLITKTGLQASYIGLKNFRDAFTVDVDFVPRLTSTISSMVLQLPLILIFAMFSALLLNRPAYGRTVFRGIFFLPVIVASGAVLQKLIDSNATTMPIFAQYDLFSILVQYIPGSILLPLLHALDALTLVMWDSGVQILIFLAGLQSISTSLYEAAKCDGATPWESFWKITFPMIMPMMLVNTLFSIVNSFTKVNNSVMQYINDTVFKKTDYGYAAALGWVYFVIIFIIILLVFFIFRNRAVYAGEKR